MNIYIGYGDRREIQYVPKESEKLALEWSGEEGFHQVRCAVYVSFIYSTCIKHFIAFIIIVCVWTCKILVMFLQLVKAKGGRQQYYPTPLKVVCPNLQDRADKLSDKSANALRNIERNQWQTTYDLNNTGLGPLNPMKLDNLDDKRRAMDIYGVEDNKLVPFLLYMFSD